MASSREWIKLGIIVLRERTPIQKNQIPRVCLQMENLYLNVMDGVKVEKESEERRKSC